MIRAILLVTLSVIAHISMGQSIDKKVQKADQLIEHKAFEEAIVLYKEILQANDLEKNHEQRFNVHFNIAKCYGHLKDLTRQIEHLNIIVTTANPVEHTQLIRNSNEILIRDIYLMKDIKKALDISEKAEIFEREFGNADSYSRMLQTSGGIYNFLENSNAAAKKYKLAYELSGDPKLKYEAIIYSATSQSESAPEVADSLFQKAIPLVETFGDSLGPSSAYSLYGNFLIRQGEHKSAIQYLLKAIDWKPKAPMFDLARVDDYNLISQIFFGLQNIEKAEFYINSALEIAERNDYKSRNGLIAMIYGQLLSHKGETEKAYEEFNKALIYFESRNVYPSLVACLSEMGIMDIHNGDMTSAQTRYLKAEEFVSSGRANEKLARFYKFKSLYLLKTGKPKKAKLVAEAAYNKCVRTKDVSCKINMLKLLKEANSQIGNHQAALSYFEKYSALNDSIFQSNQNQIIFDLESKYKRKEQDQSLALLNTQNKLSKAKLSQQNKIISIGGFALFAISLLSFFLYSLNKKIKSQKRVVQKALSEKDTLLREIHHRVKNNLQLVSSLLTLQSRSITDETAIAAINDGKARVRSMALIHQDLYNKENLTGISVKSYIEKLCTEIFHTYNINSEKIRLRTDIQDLELDVDTVVPLGLIINELITNSLKYAFPNNQNGNIYITLEEIGSGLQLQIKDNGIGVEVEKFKQSTSFGNRLVHILTEQLEGSLTIHPDKGGFVEINISNYKKAA